MEETYQLLFRRRDGSKQRWVLVDRETYHRFKNSNCVIHHGYPCIRRHGTTVGIHKLVLRGSTGKYVHHVNGRWDCRRAYLRIYSSKEEHMIMEHPETLSQEQRDRWMEQRLRVADLHPHAG